MLFRSRKLNSAENFYSSYRLELNGLILALNHFRYYLQGRHFTVFTDHRALEWIRTTQNPLIPSILIRLYESIADFDFDIKYVTPSKVACEDGISRLPFAGDHNMASWRVSGRDPWLMEDYFWIRALTKKESQMELNTYSSFHYVLPDNMDELNVVDHRPLFVPEFERKEMAVQHHISSGGTGTGTKPKTTLKTSKNPKKKMDEQVVNSVFIVDTKARTTDVFRLDDIYAIEDRPSPRELRLAARNERKARDEREAEDRKTRMALYSDVTNRKPEREPYPGHNQELEQAGSFQFKMPKDEINTWLRMQQEDDFVLKEIKYCMDNKSFPQTFEEVKKRMKEIIPTKLIFNMGKSAADNEDDRRMQNMLIRFYRDGRNGFLKIQDGLICIQLYRSSNPRPIVPIGAVYDLVHHVHETDHLGIRITCLVLNKYFYIPSLVYYVTEYINNCQECKAAKRLRDPTANPYGQVARITERLQVWSMDVLHLPKSNGYQYALVLIDLATTWTEGYPLKKITEAKVMDALEKDFFLRYAAKEVISDKGPEFRGKKLAELFEANNCELNFGISRYSNDKLCERRLADINRVIRVMLTKYGLDNDKWQTIFHKVLNHINFNPDASGCSPYERVYGISPEARGLSGFIEPETPPEQVIESKDDGSLLIGIDGEKRLVRPLLIGSEVLYAKICNVDVKDQAEVNQLKLDELRAKRHEESNRSRTKPYRPIMGELVDVDRLQGQKIANRKTALQWIGPYVVRRYVNNYKLAVQRIDVVKRKVKPGIEEVSLHSIRPTLYFTMEKRKKYLPFKIEERDGKLEFKEVEGMTLQKAQQDESRVRSPPT